MVKRNIVMVALLALGRGINFAAQILLVAGLNIGAFTLADNIVHGFGRIAAPMGNLIDTAVFV